MAHIPKQGLCSPKKGGRRQGRPSTLQDGSSSAEPVPDPAAIRGGAPTKEAAQVGSDGDGDGDDAAAMVTIRLLLRTKAIVLELKPSLGAETFFFWN